MSIRNTVAVRAGGSSRTTSNCRKSAETGDAAIPAPPDQDFDPRQIADFRCRNHYRAEPVRVRSARTRRRDTRQGRCLRRLPPARRPADGTDVSAACRPERDLSLDATDRKSVVSGKRVSVRVDLGGGGIIKKKKK